MQSNIEVPTTLRASRVQTVVLFILSLLFVFGGVLMIRDGKTMGYFCSGFFGLCLLVFTIQLHPKAAYLHLTSEGFTFCSLFRAHTVKWVHVHEFAVIYVGPNRMVAWNFTPDYPATGSARAVSKSISGYEAALPDSYGMKPQALADLMNDLRQKYAVSQNI